VPTTVGVTALNLWHNNGGDGYRTSLNGHLLTDVLGQRLIYGARDHAIRPGYHLGARYFDLVAAYPSAMVAAPFPLRLHPGPKNPPAGTIGIARARVQIPDLAHIPIPDAMHRGPVPIYTPERSIAFPAGTTVTGWFMLRELELAEGIGCTVERYKTYVGDEYADVFGQWFRDFYLEGRSLPGGSAKLAKHCGNALWGMFKHEGTRTLWAAETTARVRVRITREALYRPEIGAVYADTDGVIATGSVTPEPYGRNPGEWATKEWAGITEVRILESGSYAYRNPATGLWQVSSEFLNPDQFEQRWLARYG
jgi:hypothetical protein